MLWRLGSSQIRHSGTLGGNIANASPVGDTPPVLIALNAEVELASHEGTRKLPIEDFFVSYKVTVLKKGEYIRRITIPKLKNGEYLKVYKISKRLEDDISAVLVALKLSLKDNTITAVRSGFGGLDAIAKNAPSLEQMLLGKPLTEATFRAAMSAVKQDFKPLDDVRASADYRCQVVQNVVYRCGVELMMTLTQQNSATFRRIEQLHEWADVPSTLAVSAMAPGGNVGGNAASHPASAGPPSRPLSSPPLSPPVKGGP
jgi:xanthine dehydrogenase small subunit